MKNTENIPRPPSSYSSKAVWNVRTCLFWGFAGVACGIGALVAALGSWSSPVWAVGVGVVISLTLAIVAAGFEYRQLNVVVVSALCAGLGSLVACAWFVPEVRAFSLNVAGDYVHSQALKTAFHGGNGDEALSACHALIRKGGTTTYHLDSDLVSRPLVAARCLTESDDTVTDSLRRRVSERWYTALMTQEVDFDCALVEAFQMVSDPRVEGQRLVMVQLEAESSSARQCAAAVVDPIVLGSPIKTVQFLGVPDSLATKERVALLKSLTRAIYRSSGPSVALSKSDVVQGWNVRLGCGSLDADDRTAAEVLSSMAQASGCGFVPADSLVRTWNEICSELDDITLASTVEVMCDESTRVAGKQAILMARSLVESATQTMDQGILSNEIQEGVNILGRLSGYESRLGAEGMKESLRGTDMPPLVRNQLMADLTRGQRSVRMFDVKTVSSMKDIDNVEEMNRANLKRAVRIMKEQDKDLMKELESQGADLDALRESGIHEELERASEDNAEESSP